ncbi:MAG: transpeptidase family protein [Paludibacteraceae bacterium]|nr:transpeptidase family protein [Paludibacteraceae bacterium]
MNDNQKHTIIRFAIIFSLIALGFFAVLGKIVYTQTVERDRLMQIASRQVSRNEVLQPNRGNIYDAEGRLLAGSAPLYYIRMDTRVQALREKNGALFEQYIDSISDGLADCFRDRTAQEYKRHIRQGYNRRDGRLLLYPKRITYSQLKAVKQLPLFNRGSYKSGLLVESRYQRIRPFGSLAARSIGSIYGEKGTGSSGLEMRYESVLHGTEGQRVTQMLDGHIVSSVDREPVNGLDIRTTLDANLQDVVETQLRHTLERLGADWGTCILMEVGSGKVRAISNLGRQQDGTYSEDKNYAVTRIEPGSTFKTFALMAALDDGKVEITDSIDIGNGTWFYEKAKKPIKDSHVLHDRQGRPITRYTVKQVLAASSNVGLSKIVTSAYDKKAERFVDKLQRMGVRDSVPFDIPGTQQPKIDVPKDGETLSRMAFGYFVELPPLDILMFYNAIANDGRMVRPWLVEAVEDNGEIVKSYSGGVVKGSICKSSTLRDIRECLEAVVWDNEFGTASVNPWGSKKAQSDIVHIAGKTGTAQVFANGRYRSDQHRTLFCGYFPMEQPRYSCICVIQQRPHAIYDAGFDCGGTVRRIAEKTMAYSGSVSVRERYVSPDSIRRPPVKRGIQRDIRRAGKGTRIDIKPADSQWVRVNENYEAEPLRVTPGLVPAVIGMGARDAVYAIEQTGMLVQLYGKGRVVSQSVAPGTRATRGGTVTLELR